MTSMKCKILQLERSIIGKSELLPLERWNPFLGWTKKEIAQYKLDGTKPEGKGLAPFSKLIDQKIDEKFIYFKGLTKEQITKCIVHFALTGTWIERTNFDEKTAPSAH